MNIPSEPYNELYKTKHGTFCIQKVDKFMGKGLRELGECGEDETQLLCSLVNPGDCVIDCGANVGLRTIPLSKKVTNTGMVMAFEPERINFMNLCANIAINSCYCAYPMNAGCGASDGQVTLPMTDPWQCDNIGLIDLENMASKDGKGFTVPIITLDQLRLKPKLIKIEVEGMEADVLLGAIQTIEKHRPYLFCECFDQSAMDEQVEVIKHLGYDGYVFTSHLFRKDNFNGVTNNNFGDVTSPNILYVTKGKTVPEGFGLTHCVTTGLREL